MRKKELKIVTAVILVFMIILGVASVKNSTEYGIEFYKEIAKSLNVIQIYDSSELNTEILENRSSDGKIIIETAIGTVLDDNGNGKVMNTSNPDYDYISYRYTNGVKKGDTILSYMIYNPDTDFVDDIIERFDYIIDREKSK